MIAHQMLQKGYIVKYKSHQPRYYKLRDGIYYWSDNLIDWIPSKTRKGQFKDDSKWEVI